MDIVFVIFNADSLGAVMSTTRQQAEYLASLGHRVTVLSNRPPSWNGVVSVRVSEARSRIQRILDYLANGVCRRLPICLKLLDFRKIVPFFAVGQNSADEITLLLNHGLCDRVVICQHPLILGLRAVVKKVPIVLIAHGDVFTHPWSAFPLPLNFYYRYAARYAYEKATIVIAVSSSLAERASHYRSDRSAVVVIPNGISGSEIGYADEIDPAELWHDEQSKVTLLFVGRLVAEKGVDVLLKAMTILCPERFQLDLVGDGYERPNLERFVIEHRLEKAVRFHGSKGRLELAEMYSKADVVCLPSRSEAQGIVILEAMLLGRPVIASNVGGIPDCVNNGVTGLLVAPDDPKELAAAIERLASDKRMRIEMGRNAKLMVSDFAWPKLLERFERTLSNVRPSL